MKILFLTHRFYPYIGGIEVNSEILAHAFSEAGHEVRVLTWTLDPGNKPFPFEVIRSPSRGRLFKEHAWADVVYENNPCLQLAWPGLLFNRPGVVALRTWIARNGGETGYQDRLKKLWLRRAASVIAVSDAVRERCWPRAIVIGNPYRDNLFTIHPEVLKNRDFIFLGRLVSDKGADQAIRALSLLVKGDSKFRGLSLTIAGEGPERQNLEDLTRKLHLEDNITFRGAVKGSELADCLNSHKYMLVPSVWEEPFGNVALEGLACGCIPIVSDGGGLPDAVGRAGLVFPRGDINALADSIKTIISDPGLELELRREAISHLERHRPDVISRRYLDVIEAAAGLKMNV